MKNIKFDLKDVGGKVTLDGEDIAVRKATITAGVGDFTRATVELVAVEAVVDIALTEVSIDDSQIERLRAALEPFGYEVVKKAD